MSERGRGPDWVSKFHEAALDPRQWLAVLQELADATGSSRAELVAFGGPGFQPFNWVTETDERVLEGFLRAGGSSPRMNFRLAADDGVSTMTIVDEADYDRTRRLVQRDDYLDFCEDYGMVFGCQTVLHRESNGLVGMSLLRSRTDGRTNEHIRTVFADAARGAASAVRMQRAIEHQGTQLLSGALGAMALPCLLIDGFGQVQGLTDSARELIAAEPLLLLTSSLVSSPDMRVRRQIDQALASVLAANGKPYASLGLGRTQARLTLEFFRLPERDWTMQFAPRVILVLRDPRRNVRRGTEIVAATFGLTPAETEVALALCDGIPRRTIAANRNVSLETLRTQVRNLYSKTGCSRESELVLMMRALLG